MPVTMSAFETQLDKLQLPVGIHDADLIEQAIASPPDDNTKNVCINLEFNDEVQLKLQSPLARLTRLLRGHAEVEKSSIKDHYWMTHQLAQSLIEQAYSEQMLAHDPRLGRSQDISQPASWVPAVRDLFFRCFPSPWKWYIRLQYERSGTNRLIAKNCTHCFVLVDANNMPRDAALFFENGTLSFPSSPVAQCDPVIRDHLTNKEILSARKLCEKCISEIETALRDLKEILPTCKPNSPYEFKEIAGFLKRAIPQLAAALDVATDCVPKQPR